MADLVNLTIDGVPVAVPKGTNIVDAAKRIGNDIPVFCYHPKLRQVGMCRMCLVEVGTPRMDPATKQIVKGEDGKPVIAWMPKLQTACTTPVSEGMAVRTQTPQVLAARKDILEFLLTSHPLDCPICDKGGECPLQNLTLAHGPGMSRFEYEAKHHDEKHVPLGDLIYLDRERCIQCSRCIRFQDDLADDHVLQFHERGRNMEIVTLSDPPFNSFFSGNTTDICPVGALTTADFRFKARAWELQGTPSLCTHCPVGCNLTLNTRLETHTGGYEVKRVMPRQNEQVNEIWLCDKGRFVHHFTRAADRLTHPLLRNAGGTLVESTWEAALQRIADRTLGKPITGIAGDRIANEDAYLFAGLLRTVASKGSLISMAPAMATYYADLARAYGVGKDTDFNQLGKGDVILLVNGDLEEAAPVWFLRLRQAVVTRGARLIVANDHTTKMHRYAGQTESYQLGNAANWASTRAAVLAEELKGARHLLIVFSDEKLSTSGVRSLAISLASVLVQSGHAGKSNSGLLPLYPHGNTQGVSDMTSPQPWPDRAEAVWLIGVGEGEGVPQAPFTIVQDLFQTRLAEQADVVLPALSFAEREGTFTSGDRRVQRFYQALPAMGQAMPDWWIVQEVAKRLGATWNYQNTAQIFTEISQHIPAYAGLSYEAISHTEDQWPLVGRGDLYYGGTVYDNTGGLGLRYPADAERADFHADVHLDTPPEVTIEAVQRVRRRLYEDGELIRRSKVLAAHIVNSVTEVPQAA